MYSRNQLEILAIFCSRPDLELHFHEIGRLLNKAPGTFQKAINALEREEILKSRRQGNQRLFSINEEHPLIDEIKSIVQKTTGVEFKLKSLTVIDGIKIAFIYGSYAKEKQRPTSDVDLVIVGNREIEEEVLIELENIEKQILREINIKFYTCKEYDRKKRDKNPFLWEVLNDDHIILKGQP